VGLVGALITASHMLARFSGCCVEATTSIEVRGINQKKTKTKNKKKLFYFIFSHIISLLKWWKSYKIKIDYYLFFLSEHKQANKQTSKQTQ